jgi:UPF0755 protein
MKILIRFVIAAIVLLVLLTFATLTAAYFFNRTADIPDSGEIFTIQKGETLNSVAKRLEEDGLIRSRIFLNLFSRLKSSERSLHVGSFLIRTDATTIEIHNLLVSGKEILEKVTIPEGLSLSTIAGIIEAAEIASSEEFMIASVSEPLLEEYGIPGDSFEGYLFPDTYFFPKSYPAEKVVRYMADNFFDIIEEINPEYSSLGSEDIYRKVILASIVEREYRVPEEAGLMASVFYNRLSKGMKLQSCATVAYVITEEMGEAHPDSLKYSDLEIPSEYNTYLIEGLPPGPISNPGKTALEAAFFPVESEFLFFVLKDLNVGQHVFSESYSEHNQAKYLYLKKS